MRITIPGFSLVILIGPSGSGKSTFARRHFSPSEIISSDACRAHICDDEQNQAVTGDAFSLLHFIAAKRLRYRRLTVIDATSVQIRARAALLRLARQYRCAAIAVVLSFPEEVCRDRDRKRPGRQVGPEVIRDQIGNLKRSLPGLRKEGFKKVFILRSTEQADAVRIVRRYRKHDGSGAASSEE
ncbi:polynucleotide kinase-phosphatase [Desulfonema ishimotonii]|uniref:Polynucleotide kinase-phosphatase n=1 Tax=Desulfonema ishimotonii TaxID=45657 RepID=A0A401FT32_9BACT|nr:polynucleotide kinase-phosphatase [Desulfonema ishimotonii]